MQVDSFIEMLDSKHITSEVVETSIGTEVHIPSGQLTVIFEFDVEGNFDYIWYKDW